MKILATGPSGPAEELDALRAAGHEVVIGRPLDMPGRRAYSESRAGEQAPRRRRRAGLPSGDGHAGGAWSTPTHLRLVIVPFIGTDKIDLPAATRLGVLVANSPTEGELRGGGRGHHRRDPDAAQAGQARRGRAAAGEWARREDRGDFLFGKTVGHRRASGRIGTHVARRLAGWDVRLLAADPTSPPTAPRSGRDAPGPADPPRRGGHRHRALRAHRGDAQRSSARRSCGP